MRQLDVPLYYKSFSTLTFKGAMRILEKQGNMDAELYYSGEDKIPILLTLKDLKPIYVDWCLAKDIGPLTFIAGPPGQLNWFDGSLLTLVLDTIFWRRVTREQHVPALG